MPGIAGKGRSLGGDDAQMIQPTGATGLDLAIADVAFCGAGWLGATLNREPSAPAHTYSDYVSLKGRGSSSVGGNLTGCSGLATR
jgi:hypothetical protein